MDSFYGEFAWIGEDDEIVYGTSEEMFRAFEQGKAHDPRVSIGGIENWIRYDQIKKIDIEFMPSIEDLAEQRSQREITIFSGANNSGKSLLLKSLYKHFGDKALPVGVNRFYHVGIIQGGNQPEQPQFYRQFLQQFYTSSQNTEPNYLDLQRIIVSLNNEKLDKLLEICGDLLGNDFAWKPVRPDYRFSGWYISMDDEDLALGSTGTRLLMTLVGTLLIDSVEVLLIDEPELGLSPKIQSALARYLFDSDRRHEMFPHLKHIFIATHSHLFLNRRVYDDNFVVRKQGKRVSIEPVKSPGDLHHLQFSMLGNELETLFLPSAIVIVEGTTDRDYLSKLIQFYLSGTEKNVTVVSAGGDGITKQVHTLTQFLGDLQTSPYKNRVFIAIDQRHSAKLGRLANQGIEKENIKVWSKNGIEYYYPTSIMGKIFRCTPDDVFRQIRIEDQYVTIGVIRKTKTELCQEVVNQLTINDLVNIPDELINLLERIKNCA
ncbi:MAG: AAA family ATPase [Anaerolineae bacterium]|nr:AAA family ATPase [Anaerolineae bacterium]